MKKKEYNRYFKNIELNSEKIIYNGIKKMIDERIDIKENNIIDLDEEILSILLVDRTINKNIIWATDNYRMYGKGYDIKDRITIEKITGYNGNVIKPRVKKAKKEQEHRTKDKAEVFTPSWICNNMNNFVDESLLYKNAFNTQIDNEKIWKVNNNKIKFNKNLTWQDYVNKNVLEITCGEAPYLVSRYDTVTGDILDVNDRIGLLDRKLRVINENVNKKDKSEWFKWVLIAYERTYGFEWQGDSLLIARENMLYTFKDYYINRFGNEPDVDMLKEIALIISWNIWQMDGLKGVIPYSCKKEEVYENNLIDYINEVNGVKVEKKKKIQGCIGCINKNKNIIENIIKHNGIYSKIMDWDNKKEIRFIDVMRGKE